MTEVIRYRVQTFLIRCSNYFPLRLTMQAHVCKIPLGYICEIRIGHVCKILIRYVCKIQIIYARENPSLQNPLRGYGYRHRAHMISVPVNDKK